MEREKCVACGRKLQDSDHPYPPENKSGEGLICEDCFEQERREPAAWLVHSTGKREWISPHISSYELEGEESPARISWTRIDPWRGYYSLQPTDGWSILQSDAILQSSQDAAQLKEFDQKLTQRLEEMGIEYIKAFTKTSNLFSTGYDLLVREEDISKIRAISVILRLKYRDPQRFQATALTGKDPGELTSKDKRFVRLVERLEAGEEPEKLLRELSSP